MYIINPYRFGSSNIIFYDEFVDWASSDYPDGWSQASGTWDANNYVAENANGMQFYETDGDITLRSPNIPYTGYYVRITVVIYSVTAGNVWIRDRGTSLINAGSATTYTHDYTMAHDDVDIVRGANPNLVIRSVQIELL